MAASATDLEEIVEVVPSYFVEQIAAGATDHGRNCGGDSVFCRGADRATDHGGNREVPSGGAAGAVRGLGRPCDHAALMAVCMAMGRLMGAGRDFAAVFALLQVVWS